MRPTSDDPFLAPMRIPTILQRPTVRTTVFYILCFLWLLALGVKSGWSWSME